MLRKVVMEKNWLKTLNAYTKFRQVKVVLCCERCYTTLDTLECWNLSIAYSSVIVQKGLHTSKQLPH